MRDEATQGKKQSHSTALPYQHLSSYYPAAHKETDCSSAEQVRDSDVFRVLGFGYESRTKSSD